MKITVLGCGSSGGVPLVGENWGECDPNNPKNKRRRPSILVEKDGTTILVDTSPDMHDQLIDCHLRKLDAVLYTHAHADHAHGIDELRSVNWLTQKPVDIYADPDTMAELRTKFDYIFEGAEEGRFYKPSVLPHEIEGPFSVGPINVTPFYQKHGPIRSLGYRFGDFSYSTDVHDFDQTALETLRGTKIWMLDCVRRRPHPTHFNLDKALRWIEIVKAEQVFLTHLSHDLDYETLVCTLPKGVLPTYDGMVLEC